MPEHINPDIYSIYILSLNPNHYNIARNIQNIFNNIHIFSKKNYFFSSSLIFQHHDINNEDDIFNFIINDSRKKNHNIVVIPATDAEVLFLDRIKNKLPDNITLCLAYHDILHNVTNKFLIQEKLLQNGLKYPKSVYINSQPLADSTYKNLRFPCIIKPVYSNEWKTAESSRLLGENKVLIVNSPQELVNAYDRISPISREVIAQEIIPQKGLENYSFCSYSDANGNILHSFVTQKLIQYPDKFGTAVLCQTVQNPRITEYGTRVIKALGLDGIAETEIIVDAETDELYVIEVNPRHWMQHRLSTRIGVNYTLLDIYYRLGMQDKVQELLSAPRPKKEAIWIDDVGYLIYVAKNFFHPGRCFFREVLTKNREYSLFSFADWRPFWNALKGKLKRG